MRWGVKREVRDRKSVPWLGRCNPPSGQGAVPLLILSPEWGFQKQPRDLPTVDSDWAPLMWVKPTQRPCAWGPFLSYFQAVLSGGGQDDPSLTPWALFLLWPYLVPEISSSSSSPRFTEALGSWHSLQSVPINPFSRFLLVNWFQTNL